MAAVPLPSKSSEGSESPGAQRRLLVTLAAVVLVFLFASWFAWSLFKPAAGWKEAEFEAAVNRFQNNVMLARAEWMRRGQPGEVRLQLADMSDTGETVLLMDGAVRVLMSRGGWPQARAQGANGCMELWYLLARPNFRAELQTNVVSASYEPGVCVFYLNEQPRLQFFPANGRVQHLL